MHIAKTEAGEGRATFSPPIMYGHPTARPATGEREGGPGVSIGGQGHKQTTSTL